MVSAFLVAAVAALFAVGPAPSARATHWRLAWSDEFNGPSGAAPDPKKWVNETGGNGWGNNELEFYTDSRENSFQDGHGRLVIRAIKEDYRGRHYTSARLKTQGLFAQTYGKIEACIKVPEGQGIWPAFWTLGSNIDSVGWPTCGEIDIMEIIGKEPSTLHGSLHQRGFDATHHSDLPSGSKYGDDYHLYAVEWEPTEIRWYVDSKLYSTVRRADLPQNATWAFDSPQFVLLNLAVGGNWPGNPDEATPFPAVMLVDYVRVYKATD